MTTTPDPELLKLTEDQAIQKVLDAMNEPTLTGNFDTLVS
jgi:hypothetical protein